MVYQGLKNFTKSKLPICIKYISPFYISNEKLGKIMGFPHDMSQSLQTHY